MSPELLCHISSDTFSSQMLTACDRREAEPIQRLRMAVCPLLGCISSLRLDTTGGLPRKYAARARASRQPGASLHLGRINTEHVHPLLSTHTSLFHAQAPSMLKTSLLREISSSAPSRIETPVLRLPKACYDSRSSSSEAQGQDICS